MSYLRKYILFMALLGIVLILQYSSFMAGMDMLPGFQQSPPDDITGSVQVVSEPAGALVFFDGLNTGQNTPFFQMEVLPGNHEVMVTLSGYYSQTEKFEVFPENTTCIRLILVPVNQTAGLSVPVEGAPQSSPPPVGKDIPADDPPIHPYSSISSYGPASLPVPEFPSPAVPGVMLVGCIGVVLLVARCRD